MNVTGTIRSLEYDGLKPILSLEIKEKYELLCNYDDLKILDLLDITIEKHKKKRSLTQNSYYWKLVSKLADALNTSKEELHKELIRRYSQRDFVSLLANINPKNYFKYYDEQNLYRFNNKEFKSYIIYKRSSDMTKGEFTVLLQGLISECNECDIPTLTPEEAAKLKYIETISS